MDIFSKSYGQLNKIIKTILSLYFLITALTIISVSVSSGAFAQQSDDISGIFNHTQTDSSGNVDWINSGSWSLAGITSAFPTFEGSIDMAKPDGSAAYDHQISEFSLIGSPVLQDNTTILDGTSTITMREGPVTEEPTTINLTEESISVFFEPTKIEDHFGNQSITGTVTS